MYNSVGGVSGGVWYMVHTAAGVERGAADEGRKARDCRLHPARPETSATTATRRPLHLKRGNGIIILICNVL